VLLNYITIFAPQLKLDIMAVKMLTTKKHVKTAKVISKIKEDNKPIEVIKPMREPKKPKKRPMLRVGQTITLQEYIDANEVVKQYEKENYINLYDKLSNRLANNLNDYFKNKGIAIEPTRVSIKQLKMINLVELQKQPKFGKYSMAYLKILLEHYK
jgi:hypothetical protein